MEEAGHLRIFQEIGEEDFLLFSEKLKTRNFKKGDFIIQPGQIQKELYFVKTGVQMSYFESEKKINVIAFTYPPNLCAIPESFSFQKPSQYFLTCLSDSEMDYLTFQDLQLLFDLSPKIERLFRKMTETVLAGVLNRHMELHTKTIEERFRAFCSRSPHLLQLVPHKYISSYLGIDATNFSKLYNSIKI
jgi:CRP-like cAMP-binding protein